MLASGVCLALVVLSHLLLPLRIDLRVEIDLCQDAGNGRLHQVLRDAPRVLRIPSKIVVLVWVEVALGFLMIGFLRVIVQTRIIVA